MHSRHGLIAGLIMATAAALPAESTGDPTLFSRARMKAIELNGLRVWMGQPVEVTSGLGWMLTWKHRPPRHKPNGESAWAFIHLTPFLAQFPGGNLICTYTLDPDSNQQNPVFASGFQISRDGGMHWGRRYALLMQHNPMVFIPQDDDSLLAIPSEFMPLRPGDERNLVGPSYLFQHGGDRILTVLDGIHVVGLPVAFGLFPNPQPTANWHSHLFVRGAAVRVGRRWLITADGISRDHGQTNLILASEDGGYNWCYYATIAVADPNLVNRTDYEGPDETTLIQLADGDLMAVMRMGQGRRLQRSYSYDGGRTWSQCDVLPAGSVKPVIARTANGVTALATGRPGLYLWLADDPRAGHWQMIDLAAFHNAWAPDASYRIGAKTTENLGRGQTTSYTGIVTYSPNRLLLAYDRDPEEAPAGPKDLSRVFVLPIEIERD